jgi:hypothetical protein
MAAAKQPAKGFPCTTDSNSDSPKRFIPEPGDYPPKAYDHSVVSSINPIIGRNTYAKGVLDYRLTPVCFLDQGSFHDLLNQLRWQDYFVNRGGSRSAGTVCWAALCPRCKGFW